MPIMTSHVPKIEVLYGRERRRRWTTGEKLAIVQETYESNVTVSIVARRHGIQPNQLFAWRKSAAQGANGHRIAGRGRPWIRIQGASEPGERASAPPRQEGDGRRNPKRSV